jgi:hypothetical protein
MRATLVLAALLLTLQTAQARPVLVEMFVSQSCSSCVPADALLQQLAAGDKNILPLSLNVTYWNNLGWHDADSLDTSTERQFFYAKLAGSSDVYTPQAVVDGTAQMAGNDRDKVTAAIAAAKLLPAGNVKIKVSGGAMLSLEVSAGNGEGQIIVFGYDAHHSTKIGAGENHGTVITEVNVVRSITTLGPWSGTDERFSVPRLAGEHVAVLLQAKDGAVLGLGVL